MVVLRLGEDVPGALELVWSLEEGDIVQEGSVMRMVREAWSFSSCSRVWRRPVYVWRRRAYPHGEAVKYKQSRASTVCHDVGKRGRPKGGGAGHRCCQNQANIESGWRSSSERF